ncbi:enoyl-CoA hydratase [Mobilicoccus massiliensis]|uniref:enoyl-CoA hydratase n=1 Tax=Mobilicoccus massiliensis TaxID=1522310 RepID=UPI000B1738FE|nr:enoyl-CoA hydratase [Mobilicoccus massiliensis]
MTEAQDPLAMTEGEVLTALEGGVLTMTMNRPQSLNAMPASMLATMESVVRAASADSGVRVIVVRGAGKGFSSGADLDPSGPPTAATLDAGNALIAATRRSPRPIVSVVHGACAGIGVSVALAADLVVASEKAFFMLAFANIGLMPDGGATALVAASVGRARAMRMALLADRVPAQQAFEWGLISHVAAADDLETEAGAVIAKLASGPSVAYGMAKAAVNDATLDELDSAFQRERYGQTSLMETKDFTEGVTAFRERRTPRFTGS